MRDLLGRRREETPCLCLPQIRVWKPKPQGDALGGVAFGRLLIPESRAPTKGTAVFIKEAPERDRSPLLPHEGTKRSQQPGQKGPPASRTVRSKWLLSLGYLAGILL